MTAAETRIYEYPPVWDISTPEGLDTVVARLAGRKACLTDVDETIAGTTAAFIRALQQQHQLSIERERVSVYGVEIALARDTDIGPDRAEEITYSLFAQPELFLDIEPYPDMIAALQELHAREYTVVAVTHRAHIEKVHPGLTQDWLHQHNVPCEAVVCATPGEKEQLARALAHKVAPGSILLEDRPATIVDIMTAVNGGNIAVGAMRRPWTENSGLPTITAEDVLPLAMGTLDLEP